MSENANRLYEELLNEQNRINILLKCERNPKVASLEEKKLAIITNLLKNILSYNKILLIKIK